MRYAIACATVALALGCGSKDKETSDDESTEAPAPETAKTTASGAGDGETKGGEGEGGPAGLAHPDNDAEIVKLAKSALACEWRDSTGLDKKCEAMAAWKEQRDAARLPTFAEMLRDPDAKVRWLGAEGIDEMSTNVTEAEVFDNADLGRKILAAVRAEESEAPALVDSMSELGGRVAAGELGLLDELRAILDDHPSEKLRVKVIETMRTRKLGEDEAAMLFDLAKESSEAKVRVSAIDSLRNEIAPDQADEMCGYFGDAAGGDDLNIAAHAATALAADIDCKAHVETLLDVLETRATDGRARHSLFVDALREVHRHGWSDEAHKKRAVAIARAVLDNPDNERDPDADFHNDPRARALRFLIEDAGEKPALARKFVDDENSSLRRAAEKLVAK